MKTANTGLRFFFYFQNAMQRYSELHGVTAETRWKKKGADCGVSMRVGALEVEFRAEEVRELDSLFR